MELQSKHLDRAAVRGHVSAVCGRLASVARQGRALVVRDVRSLADLCELADAEGSRVLHHRAGSTHVYLVWSAGTAYRYQRRAGTVHLPVSA